jgi:hypothetical protein
MSKCKYCGLDLGTHACDPKLVKINMQEKEIAILRSVVSSHSYLFQEAVLDQFTVAHMSYDWELAPYGNLARLIDYHVQVALDPLVSEQAHTWVTKIAELEAEVTKLRRVAETLIKDNYNT